MGTPYTDRWRAAVRPGVQSSAEALVPLILEAVPGTDSVIDVGCGEGHFLREFKRHGVTGVGVEASWTKTAIDLRVIDIDFAAPPYRGADHFDVAVCLEVAEHLPATVAATFVEWLCDLAPVVVFSAAVPGQGGEGHVNERWQSYWAELFERCGYGPSTELRDRVWDDDRISWWYRQNAVRYSRDTPQVESLGVLDRVHPAMIEWHGRSKPEWKGVFVSDV